MIFAWHRCDPKSQKKDVLKIIRRQCKLQIGSKLCRYMSIKKSMVISMLLPNKLDFYMLHNFSQCLRCPAWVWLCTRWAIRCGHSRAERLLHDLSLGQYYLLKCGEPNVSRYLYHKSVASGKCHQSS